jgi:hypothetical protein
MHTHLRTPLFALVLAALAVASCSPRAPAAPPPTQAPEGSTPSAAPLPSASAQAASGQGKCTVVSLMPTPGPTEASLFPAPGPEDWTQGPQTASVTFLEYSDFQ